MKILWISPWFPYPPINGSKIRIYNLIKSLAQQHEVQLISFTRSGEVIDESGLEGICSQVECIPYAEFSPYSLRAIWGFISSKPRSLVDTHSPILESILRRKIDEGKFSALILSEIATACYAPPKSLLPCVFDDVEMGAIKPKYGYTKNPIRRFRENLTWEKHRSYLSQIADRFALYTVVSEIEKAYLKAVLPHVGPVEIVPNGVDTRQYSNGFPGPVPGRLIYTGALTYAANYDAIDYFLAEIFQRIRAQAPEAHLRISGSTTRVDISKLATNEPVQFTGFLDDLRPLLASSWACIVPLRVGGGTRVKILEAMAAGVPVVSTSKGVEGLEVTPEENILLGDDPETFAQQTIRLLNDPALHRRLSYAGRKLVEDRYDWRDISRRFVQLIEGLER